MSFDASSVVTYLQIERDSKPSPTEDPIEFLKRYIQQLPPELLASFSSVVTPKQRTVIPVIRNRRYKYALSEANDEFKFDEARRRWPTLWRGERDRREQKQEAADERQWAETEFLSGRKQHIGKLGSLLGDYAEEREGERLRELRRAHAERHPDFMPEEEDSDESEFEAELDSEKTQSMPDSESPEEIKHNFERLVRERFIYGLLDPMDYDTVDWNDKWDAGTVQDDEERWFDDDDDDDDDEDKTEHATIAATDEYDY